MVIWFVFTRVCSWEKGWELVVCELACSPLFLSLLTCTIGENVANCSGFVARELRVIDGVIRCHKIS